MSEALPLAAYVDGLVEGRRGTLVQQKRERQVWRVQEQGRTWFAKRGAGKHRDEVRRETVNARALEKSNLGPSVLAAGRIGDAEWIVTASAGAMDLAGGGRLEGDLRSNWVAGGLVAGLRRFHDRGFTFPDLVASHVFVHPGGVSIIDAARLSQGDGPAPLPLRGRDLAALTFSTEDLWLSRLNRVRLLRDASTSARGTALRQLFAAVDRGLLRLALRTRWRRKWSCVGPEARAALVDATGDDCFGGYWWCLFDAKYFDVVRTLPDRENRTLGRDAAGRPLFYVKVFPPTKRGFSPAMDEFAAIDRFQRAGILVNRVSAFAEDLDKGSMIAVKACAGEPLDDLLRRGVTTRERRALALQTAAIWRRMRDAGLRHRDAYACHLFAARTDTPDKFELRLIDLTRAGPAPFPRERWFVKDAAQLWHGVPRPIVTRTDAVRWLRAYFRVPKLTPEAKRFARRVAAKERSIEARQTRRAARR